MLRKVLVLSVILLVVGIGAHASPKPLYKGWWVVIGSFPTEPWQRQQRDFERMRLAAARCHVPIFNDLSNKFHGFAPEQNVFVIGAFTSETEAKDKARAVKSCFSGAYVKYGEHLGE